jgi:hypothetical protein
LALPAFISGEEISFSSKTTTHNETPGQTLEVETSKIFDVEVLQITSTGALVRWTLRSGATENERGGDKAWMASFTDVAIDLRTDPSSMPREVANWAAIRNMVWAALTAGRSGSPLTTTLEQERMAMAIFMRQGPTADLVTMAAMQGHDPVTRTAELKDAGHCQARIGRSTTQTVGFGGHQHRSQIFDASATVSTADRWIVGLHQTRAAPPYFRETTDITRVSPPPCP